MLSWLLPLLIIIIIGLIGAIIYFIWYFNQNKTNISIGQQVHKREQEIVKKVEYELKDNTIYSIDELKDIEKIKKIGIYIIYLGERKDFVYVGKAIDLRERLLQHRRSFLNEVDKHPYSKFRNMGDSPNWKQHLNFAIIKLCEEKDLTFWEQHFMKKFDALESGANTQKSNQRTKDVIQIEENTKLFNNLKDAIPTRIFLQIWLSYVEINKGGLKFRDIKDKKSINFKKGDYILLNDRDILNDKINMVLSDEGEILNENEKVDINIISKDTLNILQKYNEQQQKKEAT